MKEVSFFEGQGFDLYIKVENFDLSDFEFAGLQLKVSAAANKTWEFKSDNTGDYILEKISADTFKAHFKGSYTRGRVGRSGTSYLAQLAVFNTGDDHTPFKAFTVQIEAAVNVQNPVVEGEENASGESQLVTIKYVSPSAQVIEVVSAVLSQPMIDAIEGVKNTAVTTIEGLVDDATAEKTAAVAARNQALGFRNEAEDFRDEALISEAGAENHALDANNSKNTATAQAGIATAQAGIATNKAGEALTSAGNAHTSEMNAGLSQTQAQAYAEAIQAQVQPPLAWNASTNSPALTADSSAYSAGTVFIVTAAGNAGFAGTNFASGQTFQIGDQLRKINNQWFRGPFALADGTVAQVKLENPLSNFLSFVRGIFKIDLFGNFNITDKNGIPALQITKTGITKLKELIVRNTITANKVNGVKFTNNDNFFLLQIDPRGYANFKAGKDGKLFAMEVRTPKLIIGTDLSLESDGTGGFAVKSISSGITLAGIDKRGKLKVKDIEVTPSLNDLYPFAIKDPNGILGYGFDRLLNLVDNRPSPTQTNKKLSRPLANINHLIIYSQSLGVGGSSTPPITTTQLYNTICFSAGPITWALDPTGSEAAKYAGFIPFTQPVQETPLAGLVEMLIQLLTAENGYTANDDNKFLVSAPGNGGMSLAQLSKGTTHYAHLMKDVEYGLLRANQDNKTYNVPFLFWMQGEANLSDTTYTNNLFALFKDINADIKARTKQPNDVMFIIYQTASFNAVSQTVATPTVAIQQLNAALNKSHKNIFMAGPMYQYTYNVDGIHLPALSSKLVGASLGIAAKKVWDGIDWKPIIIQNYVLQGAILEVELRVPVEPLVLDTVTINNPGNYGFSLVSSSGAAITINSVTLTGSNRIRIVAATAILAGSKLRYGFNGVLGGSGPTGGTRGCVRDSQNVNFNPNGTNFRIYNWMPITEYTIN
ncbi:hypothetical protein [Runella sp.]|uniref:hypothetical protein n=1 Tax=Runella sp. TaxID=1960881 RepID=UPI003D10BD48